jgi:hypothetical protein
VRYHAYGTDHKLLHEAETAQKIGDFACENFDKVLYTLDTDPVVRYPYVVWTRTSLGWLGTAFSRWADAVVAARSRP